MSKYINPKQFQNEQFIFDSGSPEQDTKKKQYRKSIRPKKIKKLKADR